MDILLLRNTPFLGEDSVFSRQRFLDMLKLFTKKGRGVKKWHHRAMLIDMKKTRVIIVRTKECSPSLLKTTLFP